MRWYRLDQKGLELVQRWQKRRSTPPTLESSPPRPRSRRFVRAAVSVAAACLVLLSAKSFFLDRATLDELADIARRIGEMQTQQQEAQERLGQLGETGVTASGNEPLSPEAQDLVARLGQIREYFVRVRQDHPGEFYLTGWIGLTDEGLANFWEVTGDPAKAAAHWRSALRSYARGAGESDPISLYHLGAWYLDREDVHGAIPYLREAHQQWARLKIPDGSSTDHVAADYHWALVELWKSERNPTFATEARHLEEKALADARNGTPKEMTYQILYNAACLRALMIQAGALDATEGTQVINLLETMLSVAGESTAHMAGAMLTDTDLDGLRALPTFHTLASKAQSIVEASRRDTGTSRSLK